MILVSTIFKAADYVQYIMIIIPVSFFIFHFLLFKNAKTLEIKSKKFHGQFHHKNSIIVKIFKK
jgi:hypothetical protein